VRGVNSDAVVRGLLERGLLAEVGAKRSRRRAQHTPAAARICKRRGTRCPAMRE